MRQDICDLSRRMVADGLVVGTSGNVSVRDGDSILITPTGVDYATMRPDDLVELSEAGAVRSGDRRPTSETALHVALHELGGGTAVVHTHSPAATALSLLRDAVPRVHYQLAMFGGTVPVAEYAPYGTDELAASVRAAMESVPAGRCRAAVMRHHGTIVLGPDLGTAYDGARQLEWLCDVWLRARAAGVPAELTAEQVGAVVPRFVTYGQPSTTPSSP
ncbi:class II aldolase/adducin family protein [Pseudonocardia endophytica]|uniref:L-fuculose 1-phosphate aldolase n=1 Tax=Pseudonocardia endophytica TaxID=401976 RepID=A0A4R1HQR3_PSEEN|nr:class II aldolase/adducin family protein [Pseudonocardia endophytica]TCK22830.1 L-fuculose 1-phosphate aldolase [Pseudonocardia endophytica]